MQYHREHLGPLGVQNFSVDGEKDVERQGSKKITVKEMGFGEVTRRVKKWEREVGEQAAL